MWWVVACHGNFPIAKAEIVGTCICPCPRRTSAEPPPPSLYIASGFCDMRFNFTAPPVVSLNYLDTDALFKPSLQQLSSFNAPCSADVVDLNHTATKLTSDLRGCNLLIQHHLRALRQLEGWMAELQSSRRSVTSLLSPTRHLPPTRYFLEFSHTTTWMKYVLIHTRVDALY